jgi:aspartyl-tRNA(Asn)/glutamyl-tRNA(Gln) amidotransferase subunit A
MGEGMFVEGLSDDVAAMLPDVIAALEPSVASVRPTKTTDMGPIAELANVVAMAEAGAIHFDWVANRPEDYGEQIRARLSQSLAIPSSIYIRALQIRPIMAAGFVDTAFADCDVLIVPAMPFVPPIAAEVDVGGGAGMNMVLADMTRFTRPFSFFGLPAVTIPTGRTSAGLPVAIQVIARAWREDLAVSVARHLETALALGPFQALDPMRSAA